MSHTLNKNAFSTKKQSIREIGNFNLRIKNHFSFATLKYESARRSGPATILTLILTKNGALFTHAEISTVSKNRHSQNSADKNNQSFQVRNPTMSELRIVSQQ